MGLTMELFTSLDFVVEQIGRELIDNALIDWVLFETVVEVFDWLVACWTPAIARILIIQIEHYARLADLNPNEMKTN
jgi:hypothetical protein